MIKINISLFFLMFLFILPVISCDSKDRLLPDKKNAPIEKFSYDVVLRLPTGRDNPRNSEGDFIALKDGRIMYIYTKYFGTSNDDHAPAKLVARYSSDKGNTWTKEDKDIVEREGDMNVMSVSLLRLHDGRIALFYLRKNSINDCIPMVRYSNDEGNTWTNPIQVINDKEGYFVLNNNRVIQLENGRIIMAVALHQIINGQWQANSDLYSYFSDDNGLTWSSSERVPNDGSVIHQEPGLIELKNGNIRMFTRTNAVVQYYALSTDRGQTWTASEPSNIVSATYSPASITRNPISGGQLLVWNHNNATNAAKSKRTPLNLALSMDEGKTWFYEQVLEDDSNGAFCYTAVHYGEDYILLGYFNWTTVGTTIIRINKGLMFR